MASVLPSYDSSGGPKYRTYTSPRSTFRRRRIIWSCILLFATFCGYLYFSPPGYGASSYLKDSDAQSGVGYDVTMTSSGAAATMRIQEIHGLLHFLTSERTEAMALDRVQEDHPSPVDWDAEVDLSVFSAGVEDDNWPRNVRELADRYPIVVFSKTYCPFSKRAKALLETYKLSPPPKIIEVDLRSDAGILKQLLGRLTGRSTFPNVLLTRRMDGMSIGGSDDIYELHDNDKLKGILQQAGVQVNGV